MRAISAIFSLRKLLLWLGATAAGFAALAAGFVLTLAVGLPGHAEDQQSTLAKLISQLLSSNASKVSIGAVEGALSSKATIRNVSITDRNGVWLKVDRVDLEWSRLALLRRRLQVDNLAIGKLEILRRPAPDPAAKPAAGNEPILPELPLKVLVKAFKLEELALGAPVAGVAARLAASGALTLGPPSEGLNVNLEARRLDAEGKSQIKLSFVPKGEQLNLDIVHNEAAGGLVARLAALPGLPPVALTLAGKGPLDDFAANLDFSAGDKIGAKGDVVLKRQGKQRNLDLDITSRIEGMLPPIAAGIFAGSTTMKGIAHFGDDGAITLPNLRLASKLAELTIDGRLARDKSFDAKVLAQALPNDNGATRHLGVSIGKLHFVTTANGTFDKPNVAGKLDARAIRTPDGGFDTLTADFSVKPSAEGALAVEADAGLEGLHSVVRGLAQAAGKSIQLTVRAKVDSEGKIDVSQSRIVSPVYSASYAGRIEAGKIAGNVEADIKSLAALSELAGRPLQGAASLNADIAGEPGKQIWDVGVRSRATGLSLGDAMLNRLAGGALSLKGRVKSTPAKLELEKISATGRGFEASADGIAGEGEKGVQFALHFADASRIDPRLKGAGEIAALLAGPLNNPEGAVEIRAARMSAIGKPVRDLNIRLEARELLGALRGKLTLAGNIDGRPLKGGGDIFKKDGGGWRIAALDASLGSAKIGGEAEVGASGATNGRLSVNAPDLGQLSALALTQMRGSLQADITLAASGGRQNAQVKAQARSLVFQDIRIGAARADISATDLLTRPQLSGNIHAEQLRAGGESIGKLDVMAKGSGTTTDFTARTSGGSIVFNAAGALRNGAPMVLSLKSFSGSRRGVRVALASPATLQIANGGVSMKSLTLNAAGGQVTVSGTAGQKLNIKLNVARLPLSVAKAFDPKLNFAGTLNASADLRGAADNPQGPYTIAIDRFASSETRSSGLPPLTIRLGGQLQGKRATVKGSVRGGPKINVALDGAVPLASRGALALAIGGTVDGSLANAALTEGGQRVTGQINLNLSVRGDAAKPAIAGSATLSNGTFRDPLQGVALTAVNGRFSGRGDRLTIDTLSGRTPNGGTVSVSGSVSMDGTQGFPADLRIGASKAQLVSNDIMTLVAGLDLTVTGALVRDPAVRGRIDIRSLNVSIPERLPASAAPLRGAKHIAPPPQTRARLKAIAAAKRAAARRKRARGGGGPRIDIRIDAPSQVFVRGRGVDAELGGSLTVTGTANAPRANGAFELRRGKIDLLTQRVDFSRGRLTFLGDIVPELDFVATSSISGVTAKVNLAGRADDPKITFSSEPAMASDEVLSYLLFQKAAASLKPFEAVQLAAAVATLTGNGGPGFLDKARRALGVDTLDISAGGKDGPAVGASRYISRRISVGARAGTTPANSAATVKVDVTRRIKLLGEVTGDGRSRVGIGTEIEY